VTLLLYQIYKLLRGSLAFNIFIGFLLIYFAHLIFGLLDMQLMSSILGQFISVGFLAIFIVFQPEIRRFLLFIGRGSHLGNKVFWRRLFVREVKNLTTNKEVAEIQRAVNNLSQHQIGALIVFSHSNEEYFFSNTGVPINAEISARLIETIFHKTTPLHDGAVIVINKEIYAAGCVLPVSENPQLPARIGMRHKAAIGITEKIESSVIVVSEETGNISIAHNGKIRQNVSQTYLKDTITKSLQ